MSSTILMVIVLVVMWLVVLVPMFVRRHDETTESRSMERFATAMRVLSRRTHPSSSSRAATAAHPAVGSIARPGAAGRARADARRRMLARRRRTLAGIALLTVVGIVGVVGVGGWFWTAAVFGGLLLAGYVGWLRQEVRRERARRARRAAAFSRTAPSQPPHAVRPGTPGGPGRTLRNAAPARTASTDGERTGEDRDAERGPTWQPTPVPPPTYVSKPAARRPDPRRVDTVVALDDDDPAFADIDSVVAPVERRRAVNG